MRSSDGYSGLSAPPLAHYGKMTETAPMKTIAMQTRRDPHFFERLCAIQTPAYLWIGCADSRVPANEIVDLAPGELFVHRNVGNIVRPDDQNCLAVLQYAVDVLHISHIIVCGHYRCGRIQAAFGPPTTGSLEGWIAHVRAIRQLHADELRVAS